MVNGTPTLQRHSQLQARHPYVWFFAGNDLCDGDLRDLHEDMAWGEVDPIGVIIGDGIVKWTAGGDFAHSSTEGILM